MNADALDKLAAFEGLCVDLGAHHENLTIRYADIGTVIGIGGTHYLQGVGGDFN